MELTTAKSKSGATFYYVDGKKTAKDKAMKIAKELGYRVYAINTTGSNPEYFFTAFETVEYLYKSIQFQKSVADRYFVTCGALRVFSCDGSGKIINARLDMRKALKKYFEMRCNDWFDGVFLPSLEKQFREKLAQGKKMWLSEKQADICKQNMAFCSYGDYHYTFNDKIYRVVKTAKGYAQFLVETAPRRQFSVIED